jgi:hypothetical protein
MKTLNLTSTQQSIEDMYAENVKLKKVVIETVKYLDAEGSITADEIYDALEALESNNMPRRTL